MLSVLLSCFFVRDETVFVTPEEEGADEVIVPNRVTVAIFFLDKQLA